MNKETKEFLQYIIKIARYWDNCPAASQNDKCGGTAFSILSLIDGCSMDCDGYTIIDNATGKVINDGIALHEFMDEVEQEM